MSEANQIGNELARAFHGQSGSASTAVVCNLTKCSRPCLSLLETAFLLYYYVVVVAAAAAPPPLLKSREARHTHGLGSRSRWRTQNQ